jgi:hypothetical protein
LVVPGFTVVDLSPQCEIRLKAQYDYALLDQLDGAAELIGTLSGEIWRAPENFEVALATIPANTSLVLRWAASSDSSGVASLRDATQTLSISMLASGLNADSDRLTLEAFQRFALQELHDSGFEPSFQLMGIPERPLLATVGLFPPAEPRDRWLFALADRCFAAAYFRRLGLA